MTLRGLDDRWVPRAAAWTQRRVTAIASLRSRLSSPDSAVGAALRRHPALAGSIVAVLFASTLIAAAGRSPGDGSDSSSRVRPAAITPITLATTIGPEPGTAVAAYVAHAAADLRHFAVTAGSHDTWAAVDLRGYVTPGQAIGLFGGLQMARAFVRVPAGTLPTEVHSMTVSAAADLPGAMRSTAKLAAATARTFAALVIDLHPATEAQRMLRDRYLRDEAAARLEAARLAAPVTCRCVFAVLVHAGLTQLAQLSQLSQVRLIDPAAPTVPLQLLTVLPLEPEATTVVTPLDG